MLPPRSSTPRFDRDAALAALLVALEWGSLGECLEGDVRLDQLHAVVLTEVVQTPMVGAAHGHHVAQQLASDPLVGAVVKLDAEGRVADEALQRPELGDIARAQLAPVRRTQILVVVGVPELADPLTSLGAHLGAIVPRATAGSALMVLPGLLPAAYG